MVVFGCAEAVAFIFVWRLWLKRRKTSLASRVFWSVVLLVPVLGILLYGFCLSNPDEHPYDPDTTRNAAESFTDGRL